MDFVERQKLIINKLRPKATNHGLLETYLIAIPADFMPEIAPDRREIIARNLQAQGTNLVTVIVRRSDAYQEEEYEVVYGEDWCFVAKELGIERLWVWIFDLTDEQVLGLREEMLFLQQISPTVVKFEPVIELKEDVTTSTDENKVFQNKPVVETETFQQLKEDLENSLIQKLEATLNKQLTSIKPQIQPENKPVILEIESLKTFLNELTEKLEANLINKLECFLNEKLNTLTQSVKQQPKEELSTESEKIESDKKEVDYNKMTVSELKALAKKRKIQRYSTMKKKDLVTVLSRK